jgi:hypothetical protein
MQEVGDVRFLEASTAAGMSCADSAVTLHVFVVVGQIFEVDVA